MTESMENASDDLFENQVRMILETAMDGIISTNEAQNIILFNRAAELIFGWKSEQVLGKSIEVLIPQRYLTRHHQDVEKFGKGEIPSRRMGVQRTVMALRSTGEEFPIEASISHTMVEDQRIYTVILRDVTDAVRHRQQIEQQSQILDRVSDAVSVVDSEGRITYWNAGAHRLFEWTSEQAIGQTAFELLDRGDLEAWNDISLKTKAKGAWSGEKIRTARSGKFITVDHRRSILEDETGAVKGYVCIDIDLTIRKRMERLSNRSQRLESIGTLAGGIAHDLNNVLTPILMGAKLLASDRVPQSSHRGLLETMVASAQRGAALIQQLLSFAGGVRGDRSPVRISQLIKETYGLLEHTFPKSITIETHVAVDCPLVQGDATELTQVLLNLCINSRDAMPDGGKVTIEAEPTLLNGRGTQLHPDAKPGLYLLIKVSDTGSGMSAEVLDRIFDPFFTTKGVGKGTGLGLATVQGIVKGHDGFILVYSEPGRGSKFSVYLQASNTSEMPSGVNSGASAVDGKGRWILIVDDESKILQMTSAVLEGAGYRVLTALDGTSAIEVFASRPDQIACVLLDMMMPGIDGLETLDRLLKLKPLVKVIACSGLGTTQREKEALERGAKAFLPKPYSDEQLLQILSKLL